MDETPGISRTMELCRQKADPMAPCILSEAANPYILKTKPALPSARARLTNEKELSHRLEELRKKTPSLLQDCSAIGGIYMA